MAKSANQSVGCFASATPFSLAKLIARSQLLSHARISFGALLKGLRAFRYFSRASCLCLVSLTPTCSVRFDRIPHPKILRRSASSSYEVLTCRFEYPIFESLDSFSLFVVLLHDMSVHIPVELESSTSCGSHLGGGLWMSARVDFFWYRVSSLGSALLS